jgi:RNA polymerase sigma factor (TIGR02999 family)
MDPRSSVTQLLGEVGGGNERALEDLMPLVYDELRRIARRQLSRERSDHTLQPTALVHEAFVRLVEQNARHWENRLHFLSVAATMMRRVLIDHAKARLRDKRGGQQLRVTLDDTVASEETRVLEVLAVDEALTRLYKLDPIQGKIVELRFFGGLGVDETAEILKVSTATVKRYSNSARAWLHREIAKGAGA